MFKKLHFLIFILLICFSVYSRGQAKVTSQSLTITPENAHQVTLLAAIWHSSEYTAGSYVDVKHRFSPDGSLLVTFYSGAYGSIIRIWNTATLTETNELLTPSAFSLEDVVMSPNNQQIVLKNRFFSFQWWDLANHRQIAAIPQGTSDIRYSPDSRFIAALSDTSLSLLDAASGLLLNSFNLTSLAYRSFNQIAFSSDGHYVAASTDKAVQIWDVKSGEPVATLDGLQNLDYVSFSPDNTHIIAANIVAGHGDFSNVGIWDLSNTAKGHIFSGKIAHVSTNGRIALIQNDDETEIIDLMSGETNSRIHENACYAHGNRSHNSLSPDGHTMVSCDASDLKFIDTTTGAIRAKASTTSEFHPWLLTFSLDSQIAVTVVPFNGNSLAQCRLQLWDVQTGAELLNSPSLCNDFTISPDGSTITSKSLYGESILVLGIPDRNRSAYISVPARVIPSTIAVRAKPSPDAEITGYLGKQKEIVISGIDPSGKFYYMESYGGGWISATAGYVDLGVFSTKDQLHVRQP